MMSQPYVDGFAGEVASMDVCTGDPRMQCPTQQPGLWESAIQSATRLRLSRRRPLP
jgi:hypothetical protein